MTLDIELKTNNGSKRQNENVTLNAKLKKMYDGYKCWTKTTAERQTERKLWWLRMLD